MPNPLQPVAGARHHRRDTLIQVREGLPQIIAKGAEQGRQALFHGHPQALGRSVSGEIIQACGADPGQKRRLDAGEGVGHTHRPAASPSAR